MSADLRDEFESYVKKLTTAICKDIFLEKLEELYTKYEAGYEKYSAAAGQSVSAGRSMEKGAQAFEQSVKKAEKNMQKSLKAVSDDMEAVEHSVQKMLQDKELLEDKSRKKFLTELDSGLEAYRKEIAVQFAQGCEQISEKLAGMITPEIMQQFLDALDRYTRQIRELAAFVNETYQTEMQKNIRQIAAQNRKEQEKINDTMSERFHALMNQIPKRVDELSGQLVSETRKTQEMLSKELAKQADGFTARFAGQVDELSGQFEAISRSAGERISEKLASMITPEVMQQFLDALDENTRQTKELAAFVNETYQEEIEKNIRQIAAQVREEQEKTSHTMSERFRELMDQIPERMDELVGQLASENQKTQELAGKELTKQVDGLMTRFAGQMDELSGQFEAISRSVGEDFSQRAQVFSDETKRQTKEFLKLMVNVIKYEQKYRNANDLRQDELMKKMASSDEELQRMQKKADVLQKAFTDVEGRNAQNYLHMQERADALQRAFADTERKNVKNNLIISQKTDALQQAFTDMEKRSTHNYIKMQKALADYMDVQYALDQKRQEEAQMQLAQKSRANRSWRIYMAGSNTMILFCFGGLAYFQKLWKLLNLRDAVLAGAAFLFLVIVQAVFILFKSEDRTGEKRKWIHKKSRQKEISQEESSDDR